MYPRPLSPRLYQKYLRLCPYALIHLEFAEPDDFDYCEVARASGDGECLLCHHALRDHPSHPYARDTIVVTCDGSFKKL